MGAAAPRIVERIEDGGELHRGCPHADRARAAAAQRGQVRDAVDRMGSAKKLAARRFDRLDGEIAEMLVEPRAPSGAHAYCPAAGSAACASASAAAHQAEMAAVLARHHFEDDAGLAVALDAEHDAFVGPLHAVVRKWPHLLFGNSRPISR